MTERASSGDVAMKLDAIRSAARHDYPAGDMDSMLAEIEERCEDADPTAKDPPNKIEP